MNYNSQRLTIIVNNNINQRRRAIGKGSRETQYRSLCKTFHSQIDDAVRSLSRHRVGHTYGEVWNLNSSKKAFAKNKNGLQTLANILASKSALLPDINVVGDFIAFVMNHHNITVVEEPREKITPMVPASATATAAQEQATSETTPLALAPSCEVLGENQGDDDWESFADSF